MTLPLTLTLPDKIDDMPPIWHVTAKIKPNVAGGMFLSATAVAVASVGSSRIDFYLGNPPAQPSGPPPPPPPPPDVTAPVFASAAINGATLVMTYTEANELSSNVPPTTAFTVAVGGSARAVTTVSINTAAKTVTLTLASAVVNTDGVTVAYTDETAGNDINVIQDATGNDAATLAATTVTNNTPAPAPAPDTTAPVFNTASVNGNRLVLSYTEATELDAVNKPATTAFVVSVGAATRAVNSVSIDAAAKTVALTLASSVTAADVVRVSYTDPTGGNDALAIQDTAGNDAATLASTLVTNNTPTPPPPPPPAPPPPPGTITRVLTDNQLVANSKWNDPCVFAENGGWTMYASCGVGFTGHIRVFRMRSTDKLTWALSPSTPVLDKGAPGAWDQNAAETPSVAFFNGQYHMFYTGYPGDFAASGEYKIGHATSADGITWTKDPNNPVFIRGGAGTFNEYVCAEPGCVATDTHLWVYMTGIGFNTDAGINDIHQTIGLSVSTNGTTFSTPVRVIAPQAAQYPRAQYYGFSTPQPAIYNNQMLVMYDIVQEPWKQIGIGNAMSPNGQNMWTTNSLPVMDRSVATWCSNEILAPSAYFEAGVGLNLWFAGNNGVNLSIGHRVLVPV